MCCQCLLCAINGHSHINKNPGTKAVANLFFSEYSFFQTDTSSPTESLFNKELTGFYATLLFFLSLYAAAFARLPQIAILHQLRVWFWLISWNHSMHLWFLQGLTCLKSFKQINSPIACAIGKSNVLVESKRRCCFQRNTVSFPASSG